MTQNKKPRRTAMTQEHYTTKRRKFKHLTKEKRAQIEILLKQGIPKVQIAKEIGISRSTLYNELFRGSVEQLDSQLRKYHKYFYDAGQRVYENNRRNSRPPLKLMKAYSFVKYAEEKMLKEKRSPDSICGREKIKREFDESVCTKTLYNYIDQGLLSIKNIDLPLRVRRNVKKEQIRKNIKVYGISIELRPDEVDNREEFGHWEIDTVLGCSGTSSAFLTIDERKSRKRHIIKIESKTAEAVGKGIKQLKSLYGERFNEIFKTVTSDNGSEFTKLSEQLSETKVYYAHPYSAWERGTNEKQNSLIRRFFPKGTNLDKISDEQVVFVENWINNLPRKIFNYSTSNEIFESVLFDIAI